MGLRCVRGQPLVVQMRRYDDGCALFIAWLVELTHDGVLVGVDCQHGKTDNQLSGYGIFPSVPKTGNGKRFT